MKREYRRPELISQTADLSILHTQSCVDGDLCTTGFIDGASGCGCGTTYSPSSGATEDPTCEGT